MKKLTFTLLATIVATGMMFGQLSGGKWMRSDKQIPADWSAEYTQEFVEIFHVSYLANGLDTSATDWYTALDEIPVTYTLDHFNENRDDLRKPADAADLSAEVGFVFDADAVWGIVKVTDDEIISAEEKLDIFYSSYPDSLPYAMYQEFDTFTDFSLAPKSNVAYWSRFGGGQIIWAGVLNNPSFDGVKWTLADAYGSSYAGNEINAGFKAAQTTANDYYMVFSIPFATALNNLDPIANPDTAISIEVKVVDQDTGKDPIEMTLASDSNESWMTMIYNARASFVYNQYELNTSKTGNGTVTKTPDKIKYNEGDEVQLEATPSFGYTFENWSGDINSTQSTISVTMDSNISVTANFSELPKYTLTVNTLNGTVVKAPVKTEYYQGEEITLTADPAFLYQFVNWTGDLTGTENPVTFTITGNMDVTANFEHLPTYPVNIVAKGGTVNKSPDNEGYYAGEKVTLTANPSQGSNFTSWGGDASGTSIQTVITVTGEMNVVANFTQFAYFLTVTSQNGFVQKNPDKNMFDPGETVSLTAYPASGYEFINWTGDTTGNSATISFVMDSSINMTANYRSVTGMAKNSAEIMVYPVPCKNTLYFSSQLDKGTAIISNLAGQVTAVKEIEQGQKALDVATLLPGAYIIRITGANNEHHIRFVKE